MDKLTMKHLPEGDRPYEKCLRQGPESLSDRELLAVIIRTGSKKHTALELADRILALGSPPEGLLGLLHHSQEDFCTIDGIGRVKAIQLLCIGELSRRIWKRRVLKGPEAFTSPEQIAEFYMEDMRHLEREEIRVMFLDTKQKLIRDLVLSRGTVSSSVITPREVLIEALRCLAVSMILVHNHPSGDPVPSKADLLLTERVKRAGDLVGVALIDHIVIGDGRYISFRQENIIL